MNFEEVKLLSLKLKETLNIMQEEDKNGMKTYDLSMKALDLEIAINRLLKEIEKVKAAEV